MDERTRRPSTANGKEDAPRRPTYVGQMSTRRGAVSISATGGKPSISDCNAPNSGLWTPDVPPLHGLHPRRASLVLAALVLAACEGSSPPQTAGNAAPSLNATAGPALPTVGLSDRDETGSPRTREVPHPTIYRVGAQRPTAA